MTWQEYEAATLHCPSGVKLGLLGIALGLAGAIALTRVMVSSRRRQLLAETSRWERFVKAVTGVLRPAESEEGQ